MEKRYRYSEDKILEELGKYINSTYDEHYSGKDFQVLDIFEGLGSVSTFCRDNAIKYLFRYGKKDGKNKKDLMKVLHYVILLIHFDVETDMFSSGSGGVTGVLGSLREVFPDQGQSGSGLLE